MRVSQIGITIFQVICVVTQAEIQASCGAATTDDNLSLLQVLKLSEGSSGADLPLSDWESIDNGRIDYTQCMSQPRLFTLTRRNARRCYEKCRNTPDCTHFSYKMRGNGCIGSKGDNITQVEDRDWRCYAMPS